MEHRLGTVLAGRYRIVEVLGRGAGGVVYLSEVQGAPDGKVLVRQLPNPADELVEWFLSTAEPEQAAVQRLVDTFSTPTERYQVLEYFPDETNLSDVLRTKGPMSQGEAISLGLQLAAILKVIHSVGIVHCDVKPANVLVTRDGKARLMDFGIAGRAGARASPAQGTLPYASPEQCCGVVSPKGDIYAFGAVLYHVLTAKGPRRPFSFEPIQRFNPRVSSGLARLIHACLQLDAKQRPSAEEVYDRLRELSQRRKG